MKRVFWMTVVGFIFCLTPPRVTADEEFFFRRGDRVLFLGDSITEQYEYSTMIELYLTSRFPQWNLLFLNAGIGGDTSTGGSHRFAEHVLAEHPTALTIDFGMNDGGYGNFDPNRQAAFLRDTEAMLEAAKKADIRVALISPNAVDIRAQPTLKTYLETQKRFYAPLKELAAKYQVPFVDQYAVTRAVLEKIHASNSPDVHPFPDGVHTSGQGGLLMAHIILVGLHAPALVSSVRLDASSGEATTKGCKASKIERGATGVSFERLDDALPMPLSRDWLPILPYIDHLKDLNWYGLEIANLPAGKYDVLIDGQRVATHTHTELAAGVNLGNVTTGPIYDQGQALIGAVKAKNNLVHQRFRNVLMFQAPDWLADVAAERKPRELTRRREQIETLQKNVYRLAQPTSHRFEVKAAS